MPLFKRRRGRDEGSDATRTAARVIPEDQLLAHLEKEMIRLKSDRLPLAIISVVAQVLPGEHLHPGEMEFASHALAKSLRADDVMSVLGDGAMVAVIGADAGGGRVVAHRVAADLAIKSHGRTTRKWLAGAALFPEDGADARELVQRAIDQAH